jgi:hypothetical protein
MHPKRFLYDEEEIERTIGVFFPPGAVFEVRVLEAVGGGTVSGYFDGEHLADAAAAAAEWSGKALGVYFTLNPVIREVMARAVNRMRRFAKHTTKNEEILSRRWLPLDFDPVRPKGISSTEEEHRRAIDRAFDCRDYLRKQGWPDPVVGDSGNGAHVVYPTDLPNDAESTEFIRGVLESLADRFGDSVVTFDRSVFNAARIWKLYGTLSAKGDSTPERPHRIARILEVPTNG